MSDLASMRKGYTVGALDAATLGNDPLAALERWIVEAAEVGALEPNAFALASVAENGSPSLRFVLCKGVDAAGISFYTNLESRKARELDGRGLAAATFWWDVLERQVRLEGVVARVPDTEADAYFASRPKGSRVGAWASPQSQVIAGREELERRAAEAEERFAGGGDVPRPPFWGGYRITPVRMEFWQGRESRLHDRIAFERDADGAPWRTVRLAP
jgi:pyridoxamine-phosphate oxidase